MRSIRIAMAHEPVVQQLCIQSEAIFTTRRDLYVFAAFAGYSKKTGGAPQPPFHELDGRVFDDKDIMDSILSLALAESGKKEVLSDTDSYRETVAVTFERFIDGGLSLIQEWLTAKPSDSIGEEAIISGLHAAGFMNAETGDSNFNGVKF